MRAILTILIALLPLAARAQAAPGQRSAFGPFGTLAAPVTREARFEAPARARAAAPRDDHFLALGFRFYQRVISPMDGPRCRHSPTCSLYAYQAVRRRGLLLGLMLTVDRLLSTGRSSALRWLPLIQTPGGLRFHDPVDAATFWLGPAPAREAAP